MKREQIVYLTKRVKSIADQKKREINNRRCEKYFSMDFDEKYNHIKAGRAKLKPKSELNCYTDLKDSYVFPGEELFYSNQEKLNKLCDNRIDAVQAELDVLLDKINIEEDAKTFIDLLEKFSKKKF